MDMEGWSDERLGDFFQLPSSDEWDRIRLKDLVYSSDDGVSPRYSSQYSVQVFQSISKCLEHIDIFTFLDCLRVRVTLSHKVVKTISQITEDDVRYLRLISELHKRATVPSCEFLNSLYLSLLDSCESSYSSSSVEHNFDAAKQVRKRVIKDVTAQQQTKTDPIDDLRIKLEVSETNFSHEAISDLIHLLGVSELIAQDVELPTMLEILNYLSDSCSALSLSDIVKSFILSPGCGCLVSGLLPVCESNPPDVTRFFHNLPGDSWIKIAHFMGCPQRIISAICKEHSATQHQVQMFLRYWRMPDCDKQCNLEVLKELKKKCGIKDEQLGQQAAGNLQAGRIGTVIQHATFNQQFNIFQTDERSDSDVTTKHSEKKLTQKTPLSLTSGNPKQEALLKACMTKDWTNAKGLLLNPNPDQEEQKQLEDQLLAVDEVGRNPLYHTILKGNLEVVKLMMSKGARLTMCIDNDGVGVLQHSSVLKNVELLEVLLAEIHRIGGRVDEPNKDGTNSPLLAACKLGDSEGLQAVELLLQHGAKPDGHHNLSSRPVIEACEGGHKKILERLMKKGANINLQDRDGNTALLKACLAGRWSIVLHLLTFGDINIHRSDKKGTSPLFAAIIGGKLEIVETLLQRGAKVNVIREVRNPHIHDITLEETPLACACSRGFQKIIEMLLLNGADINHLCSGVYTALSFAIFGGQGKIVKDLLERKQLDTSLSGLRYPIIIAVTMKNYECAELLMQKFGGPEKVLESALKEEYTDLEIALADYNEQKHHHSSVWRDTGPLQLGTAEQSLYKFCQISLKTLWNSERDVQPPQICEIVSADGTYPLLSQFMSKVAKRSVQSQSLVMEFFGIGRLPSVVEPSPFRFLTQNGYLSYDDFMAQAVGDLGDDLQNFVHQFVEALHCIPGCDQLPYEADQVMHLLFGGALQFTTIKPIADQLEILNDYMDDDHSNYGYSAGEVNSQPTGRSGSGNFDPYKPMIGGQTFDERRKERNLSSSSSSEQPPSKNPPPQRVKSKDNSKPKLKPNNTADNGSRGTPQSPASTPSSQQRPGKLSISDHKSSVEFDVSPETPEEEVKWKYERFSSLGATVTHFDEPHRETATKIEPLLPQGDRSLAHDSQRLESGSLSSTGAEVINIQQTIETAEQLRRMFQYAEAAIVEALKGGKIKVCIIANHENN